MSVFYLNKDYPVLASCRSYPEEYRRAIGIYLLYTWKVSVLLQANLTFNNMYFEDAFTSAK